MAKEPKYDTEHIDEIYQMLNEGVKRIEKEVNERFPYHDVKPHETVSGPLDAFSILEGDVLSVQTRLGVSLDNYKPQGYKKNVALFHLDGVVEITDLLLHQEDKKKPFGTAQLKPIVNIRDKENIYYGPYPDRTRFIHDEYTALCHKVEKTILDKYGTKCICNFKSHENKKVVNVVYKKGDPEQYKEYFIWLIKSWGYDANSFVAKDAKENYGVIITQADLDASPVKSFKDFPKGRDEPADKPVLKLDIDENKSAEEKEELKDDKKVLENQIIKEEKVEVKPVEKKKSRFQQWREDRELDKLLDDVLPKEKKVKKRKSYNTSGVKGFFSKVWDIVTVPFILLWEHTGPFIKKVGLVILSILSSIWDVIVFLSKGVATLVSKLFYGVTSGDIIFVIVPVVVSITLAVFSMTGLIDKLGWRVSTNGTLFGYDFELSGLTTEWFEDTDHGFFSAITLGLVQLLLILLSYIGDLVIHLVFLVVALLWALIQLILQIALQYVLPVFIPGYLLVKLILGDRRGIVVIGFIVSVICAICYFTLPYIF